MQLYEPLDFEKGYAVRSDLPAKREETCNTLYGTQ